MNLHGPEDRRASTRFQIQAPAVATIGSREIWCFTRNISTRAAYFTTVEEKETLPIGTILDFVIKIPPSMSMSKPCFITGKGRTVRIDNIGGDETGVVVEILEYDIQRDPSIWINTPESRSGTPI